MTNEQRYQKYIKEHCNKCKNKETDLCDIRIFVLDNTVCTKCMYYERKDKSEKKKQPASWQKW